MITNKISSMVILRPEGKIYDEYATTISIDDEGAGAFLRISQHPDDGRQELRIDFDEWPAICRTVETLAGEWLTVEDKGDE